MLDWNPTARGRWPAGLPAPISRLLCLVVVPLLLVPSRGSAQFPRWEASVWGGYSSLEVTGAPEDVGSEAGIGLRFAELAIWYSPELRLWVQYDDGLTLDNPLLRNLHGGAPSLYTGGLYSWGGRFITRLEGGWREVEGVGQTLVRGEQVAFLARPLALRAGGWAGTGGDGRTELLWHGGLTWIVSRHLHIDPTLFFSPSQGGREPRRLRALLFGEYQSDDEWKVGVGVAGGKGGWIQSDSMTTTREQEQVIDTFLLLAAPIKGGHEARLLFRREAVDDRQTLSTISVGLTVRTGW